MKIDYAEADLLTELAFEKLEKRGLTFPEMGTLSVLFKKCDSATNRIPLAPNDLGLLASAGIEMWHRAIHSFLWSVALTKTSQLWASVSGYYASHFVMRAFAHSMGIFYVFRQGACLQVCRNSTFLPLKKKGEHSFYWKAVCEHSRFAGNTIFRTNDEKDDTSEASHRTFANYIDHLNAFGPQVFPPSSEIGRDIEQISRIKVGSAEEVSRNSYPDVRNVQILAYQRIVAFHDEIDSRFEKNRFWKAHRRPSWGGPMTYQVEAGGLEDLPT